MGTTNSNVTFTSSPILHGLVLLLAMVGSSQHFLPLRVDATVILELSPPSKTLAVREMAIAAELAKLDYEEIVRTAAAKSEKEVAPSAAGVQAEKTVDDAPEASGGVEHSKKDVASWRHVRFDWLMVGDNALARRVVKQQECDAYELPKLDLSDPESPAYKTMSGAEEAIKKARKMARAEWLAMNPPESNSTRYASIPFESELPERMVGVRLCLKGGRGCLLEEMAEFKPAGKRRGSMVEEARKSLESTLAGEKFLLNDELKLSMAIFVKEHIFAKLLHVKLVPGGGNTKLFTFEAETGVVARVFRTASGRGKSPTAQQKQQDSEMPKKCGNVELSLLEWALRLCFKPHSVAPLEESRLHSVFGILRQVEKPRYESKHLLIGLSLRMGMGLENDKEWVLFDALLGELDQLKFPVSFDYFLGNLHNPNTYHQVAVLNAHRQDLLKKPTNHLQKHHLLDHFIGLQLQRDTCVESVNALQTKIRGECLNFTALTFPTVGVWVIDEDEASSMSAEEMVQGFKALEEGSPHYTYRAVGISGLATVLDKNGQQKVEVVEAERHQQNVRAAAQIAEAADRASYNR